MRTRVLAAVSGALLVTGLAAAPPALAAAPTITSFSPTSGPQGTTVTITGTNFAAPATVKFDSIAGTSTTVVSATSITSHVPATAGSGKITVITSGGTATSTKSFTVSPGAHVTPTVGPPGTPITAQFSGMSANEAVDVYVDTAAVGLVSADGNGTGKLATAVPASATPGTHWITAVGRHSGRSAQVTFTVRTNWPQYGEDAAHRGVNTYENVLDPAHVRKIGQDWQTAGIYFSYAQPAVVNGVVYQTYDNGQLVAFDESSGALLWSFTAPAAIDGSAAVVGGVAYVVSNDGFLDAVSTTTHSELWRTPCGESGDTGLPTAVVSGGAVYANCPDGSLLAANATTGSTNWTVGPKDFVDPPTVVGASVYVAYGTTVAALSAGTGTATWTFPLQHEAAGGVLVVNGAAYVTDVDAVLYDFFASNGAERWATGISNGGRLAYGDGRLFTAGGLAVNPASGTVLWSTDCAVTNAVPTVADGVVYFANGVSGHNITCAVDAADGTELWTASTGNQLVGPVVVDGAVFLPDNASDSVLRYDVPSGASPQVSRPDPRELRP